MRVLLVTAYPPGHDVGDEVVTAARAGLAGGGHDVDQIDLVADGFEPFMSAEEHAAYETDQPILDAQVADHAERVGRAQAMVFAYDTVWASPPPILKGWFERVLVPGVTFVIDPVTRRVVPAMTHVEHLVGISTYELSAWRIRVLGDGGRRTIARTLRLVCKRRHRARWLAFHQPASASDAARREFFERVEQTLADL